MKNDVRNCRGRERGFGCTGEGDMSNEGRECKR